MLLQFLITTFLVYFFGGLIGYVVHWAFHQKWAGKFYKIHKTHHEVMYPSRDFLSDVEYRHAGNNSTAPHFAMIVMMIISPAFFMMWLYEVPVWIMILVFIESATIGISNNLIHSFLHIRGHWFERFKFFRRWRIAHRIHHANTNYNFGIMSFEWDQVFQTFKKPKSFKK